MYARTDSQLHVDVEIQHTSTHGIAVRFIRPSSWEIRVHLVIALLFLLLSQVSF